MGIKDLNGFLKKKIPNTIKKVHLKEHAGKRVAIDTSIYFYKFLYKHPIFIEQFLDQIYRLVQSGITPIYIFDGKPPKEKQDELNDRKERKDDMKDKMKQLKTELKDLDFMDEELSGYDMGDIELDNITLDEDILKQLELNSKKKNEIKEEIDKIEKKLIYVTWHHNQELKEFLKLIGIPFIQAQCEADAICSELVRRGVVDLVMSDDMDLLVDGTQILLRDFHTYSYHVTEYNVEEILLNLGFTRKQWIDFCILCGCDYTKRIYGLGPQKAYALIKELGTLPEVLNKYVGEGKRYTYEGEYPYEQAYHLFTYCAYFKPEYELISFERPAHIDENYNTLAMYCSEMTNYGEATLDSRLQIILNR